MTQTTTNITKPQDSSEALGVRICHIKSQDEIYIHHASDIPKLELVERAVQKYGLSPDSEFLRHPISVGTKCIVFDESRKKWVRAEVVESTENLSTFCFTDFQIEEQIPVDKNVKSMARFLRKFPAFAKRVSLRTEKSESPVYDTTMTDHLRKIFDRTNGAILMKPVRQLEGGGDEPEVVEFFIPTFSDINGDNQIPIKEFLATVASGHLLTAIETPGLYRARDIISPKLVKSKRYTVQVTQLRDKNNFSFVARHVDKNSESRCEKLRMDMNVFYKENQHRIEVTRTWPLKAGMIVAVCPDENSNDLFRGRVENVRYDDGNVQIFLVDFGVSQKIHWSQIYKLADQFLQVPEATLFCSLKMESDLEKEVSNADKLSDEFDGLVSRDFVLRIDDVLTGRSCRVTLFDCVTKECVNKRFEDISAGICDVEDEANADVCYDNSVFEAEIEAARKLEEEEDRKNGFRVINITHCKDPSSIYIRSLELATAFRAQERDMRSRLLDCQPGEKKARSSKLALKIRPGFTVAAKVKSQIYRALVQSYDTDTRFATLKLVDTGRTAKVHVDDLAEMPKDLRKTNQYCICVKLSGIKPTGSKNVWSFSAIDEFNKIIVEKRLFVKVCGPIIVDDDGERKVPVRLFEKLSIVPDNDSFAPAKKVMSDLAEKLIEKGFAVRDPPIEVARENEAIDSVENFDLFSNCGSSVIEGESADFLQDDLEDEETSLDSSLDEARDWLPPCLPKSNDFIGKLTYIDEEGQFYVQPDYKLVEAVEKILTEKFDQKKCSAESMFFQQGDLVISKYPGYPGWYRGKVISVNEDQDPKSISVLFVDYGEIKDVYPWKHECHKSAALIELPILCVRCRLDNIVPVGEKYETAFLNDTHATFVDRIVRVKVAKQSFKFPLPATIQAKFGDEKTENWITVSKFFIEKKAAMKVKKSCVWFDSNYGDRYESAANFIKAVPNIPEDGDEDNIDNATYGSTLSELISAIKIVDVSKGFRDIYELTNFTFGFPVLIESSETPHIFVAKPQNAPAYSYEESDNIAYLTFIEQYLMDLNRMNGVICEVAASADPIEKPRQNMCCLARFSADGLWYRATILDIDPKAGQAKVLYVDFGNCEILPTAELREIPIVFQVLPKQAILVEVDELKTMFPSAVEEFRNKMSQMAEKWTVYFKKTGTPCLMVYRDEVFYSAFEAVSNWKPTCP